MDNGDRAGYHQLTGYCGSCPLWHHRVSPISFLHSLFLCFDWNEQNRMFLSWMHWRLFLTLVWQCFKEDSYVLIHRILLHVIFPYSHLFISLGSAWTPGSCWSAWWKGTLEQRFICLKHVNCRLIPKLIYMVWGTWTGHIFGTCCGMLVCRIYPNTGEDL